MQNNNWSSDRVNCDGEDLVTYSTSIPVSQQGSLYPTQHPVAPLSVPLSGGVFPSDPRTTSVFAEANTNWIPGPGSSTSSESLNPTTSFFCSNDSYNNSSPPLQFEQPITSFGPPPIFDHGYSLAAPNTAGFSPGSSFAAFGPLEIGNPYTPNSHQAFPVNMAQRSSTTAQRQSLSPRTSRANTTVSESRHSRRQQADSDELIPFGEIEYLKKVFSNAGEVTPGIDANVCDAVFSKEGGWISYRRNYIAVDCSYTLDPLIPNEPLFAYTEATQARVQIQALAMGLEAVVDKPDGKAIELIQYTAKRDKGPVVRARIEKFCPSVRGHGNGNGNGGSVTPLLPRQFDVPEHLNHQIPSPEPTVTQHKFERLQFKAATANNGRRRAAQQFYHVIVGLYADLRKPGAPEPHWEMLARKISDPLIVRGRSPGHYKAQKDQSQDDNGGNGGGAAGGAGGPAGDNNAGMSYGYVHDGSMMQSHFAGNSGNYSWGTPYHELPKSGTRPASATASCSPGMEDHAHSMRPMAYRTVAPSRHAETFHTPTLYPGPGLENYSYARTDGNFGSMTASIQRNPQAAIPRNASSYEGDLSHFSGTGQVKAEPGSSFFPIEGTSYPSPHDFDPCIHQHRDLQLRYLQHQYQYQYEHQHQHQPQNQHQNEHRGELENERPLLYKQSLQERVLRGTTPRRPRRRATTRAA